MPRDASVSGRRLGRSKRSASSLQRRPRALPCTQRRRKRAGMGGYREVFQASVDNSEAFWAQAARAASWTREPRRVLDAGNPPFYRWFPDGELNTCAIALDRHVADGRGEVPALIYDSPVTGTQCTYSYAELL